MRSNLHLSAKRVLAAASVAALAGVLACSAADPGPSGGTGKSSGTGASNGSGSGSSGTGAGSGSSGTPAGNGATPPGTGTGGTTTPGTGTGGTTTPGAAGTISKDETWATGKQITGAVVIAPGVTVTIDAGASVTIADAATITVAGTLKGTSTAAAHAKLTGAAWGGIVVEQGGTLSLDGVDLQNAATALDAKGGVAAATYANGIITAATNPFTIAVGGKLTLDHSSVVGSKGMSSVAGALTATHLDYDSNGSEGIAATDASAVLTIDDSKFHGTSNSGGDMIVANNAATLHISHSEISKCHCAFHFNAITSFDVSFMNVHDDSYGFMMYGSSATAGTRTVSDSNFTTLAGVGIDEAGTNGLTTVTNCYFNAVTGGNQHIIDAQVKISAPAKALVPGTGPRP